MITLYDIPSQLDNKAWSPNTYKTRISLKYKGIPYKTEWVEYPDIEPVLKRIGGAPTGKKADGSDLYTVPAVHDSTTGKVITDSRTIAEYLDVTYPETPVLFPPGTRAAIAVLEDVFRQAIVPLWVDAVPATCTILNPPSEAYFRRTCEERFGMQLEKDVPRGTIHEAAWERAKEVFDRLAQAYGRNGEDKPFFLGDTFSFGDANILGSVAWLKMVLGEEHQGWKMLTSWNNGRWGKLVDLAEKLQIVA